MKIVLAIIVNYQTSRIMHRYLPLQQSPKESQAMNRGIQSFQDKKKMGFESDTRRRRRANTLLLNNSMRRSWQQLNGSTKLPLSSGYLITKESRILNHSNFSHSPLLSLRRKVSEPELFISRSSQNRALTDVSPPVKIELNSDNITAEETNRTCFQINPNREEVITDNNDDGVHSNSIFDKTDVQTVINEQIKCITPSNLNEKGSEKGSVNGYDEPDKVQNVTTNLYSSDSEQNLNNSENIVDLKNHCKNNIIHQKLSLDKNTNTYEVDSNVSKVELKSEICVTNTKDVSDLESDNTNSINITSHLTDKINEHILSEKPDLTKLEISINSDTKNDPQKSLPETEICTEMTPKKQTSSNANETGVSADIIKVKVKKNLLPEFEVVSFSSSPSPSNACPTNINNNNDEAVVVMFINDEPMTKEALQKEYTKCDASLKSTPIQGILRLRSHKESNSEDNSSDSLTKSTAPKISQKKVHFAENCLHNRNTSRGRSRPLKSRHYSSYGVVASINDKKAANRRPTLANSANTLSSKRVSNVKLNASTHIKKDVRSAQLIDDKQQILKLTELCEHKTKQLKTLCLDQNYMRLAFDSLSVVIQHLIEQYTPFENPKLKQAFQNANKRCEQLKDNLDAKNLELNDMKVIYEEQINQLMKEREKNYSDFNQAKVNHESNVKKLYEMHSWEVKTLEDKHTIELQICQQNCNQMLNEIQDKNNELNQTKQLKDALEIKVKQMEENIMNNKEKKFKYLTEKAKQLELEVDSLKVVMDMKNEKIHTLERQLIETQEKINELPLAKETIRGLQQQTENLQVTLERKIHQFNQLTREREDLKNEYDREMREKRRLSMKNEELAYHLSESINSESGFNNCTNYDSNHISWKSPAIMTEETPIKTNRAFISSASASSRKSHSKIIKSMSTSMSSTNSKRATPLYCRSSSVVTDNENRFVSNGIADEVLDNGTTFAECNLNRDSGRKSSKSKMSAVSDETPPQCILDSGFEEIQGLNSLPK